MSDITKRIIVKKGNGVPTIPPSADHRDGTWSATDIYEGEFYLDLVSGDVYTNFAGSITNISATSINTASKLTHVVKYGEAINKGQAVYVSSSNGTNIIVSKASNLSESTSSKTLGLVDTTGALNSINNVVTEGLLNGLNTSTATIGDSVWLGTSGNLLYGLANKPVAPAHMVFIGIVTRVSSTNGEIFVKVQNGFELEELHNVLIQSLVDKDILYWDNATSLWKNTNINSVIGYSPVNQTRQLNTTSPLQGGGNLSADRTLSILQATTSQNGYLSSTDWNTFNGKQNALTLTTSGTSGAATFIGSTINIPNYSNSVSEVFKIMPNETYRGIEFSNNSTSVTTSGGITMSTSASNLAQAVASTNYALKQIRLRYYASVVSTGRYTGTRGSALLWYIGGGFRFVCDVYISDTAYGSGCRQFYGLQGSTADLTYTDTILVNTLINCIGVGSEATDTNLQVFYNDGTGTCSKIDLGASFPANRDSVNALTTVYSIEIYNPSGSSNVNYKVINKETGAIVTGALSTDLPAATQGLNFFASRCMGTAITNTGQFDLLKLGVYSL